MEQLDSPLVTVRTCMAAGMRHPYNYTSKYHLYLRMDLDGIGSGCHLLPHFNPDTKTNADLIGYEYKTDSSNPDTNPDTFSI